MFSRIDPIFAEWDKPDSPGCALAVVQNGQIAYARGYGMANLEYDIPITLTSIFHIASISKQFTAMAVALLAQEGKLTLDDDIRRYLPELADFGSIITPRHLLNHTSGLRDQWELLILAGWRMDDVVTAREIIGMIDAEAPLETVDPNYHGEVAERWRYRDGSGEIGVIASVTQAFCRDCTRIRLSTDGKLFTCLFATTGHDLRALLRGEAADGDIKTVISGIWNRRTDRYSEIRTANTEKLQKIEMSYIGG